MFVLALVMACTLEQYAQPEFHAAFSFEPEKAYIIRVQETRIIGDRTVRSSTGRVTFVYKPSNDGQGLINATIDLGEYGLTEQQAAAVGLKPTDLQSTAQFEIGDDFQLLRIRNWKELGEQSLRVATAILQSQVSAGLMDQEPFERAIAYLQSLASTHDGVFSMYSKRVGPYFLGFDWRLEADQPVIQDSFFNEPFSADPMPATLTTSLVDDPDTKQLVEYQMVQSVESDAIHAALSGLVAELGATTVEEANKMFRHVEMSATASWVYSLDLSAVTRTSFVRVMTLPNQPRAVETWTWELMGTP